MNYFETLGVDVGASEAEIAAAYRRLAQQFHPDQHPEAGPAERAAWTHAMSSVNEAYNALKDPQRREEIRDEYRPGPSASHASSQASPGSDYRPGGSTGSGSSSSSSTGTGSAGRDRVRGPSVGECDLCGSAPARPMKFKQQTAYVFAARAYETNVELCRSCGLAIGRSRQNRTLLTGWWGVISAFRNVAYACTNALELNRASKLGAPSRDPMVAAPLTSSMVPGKSVFARSGFWVTVAIVVVVALAIQSSSAQSSSRANGSSTTRTTPVVPTWKVGNCVVDHGSTLEPVFCSQPHDGKIDSSRSLPSACPTNTEWYAESGGLVWCVDADG